MILSTSFFTRAIILPCLFIFCLGGCAVKNERPVDRPATDSAADAGFKMAVFSVVNQSGTAAPIDSISLLLIDSLKANGLDLVAADVLDSVTAKHRIRYLGGLDESTSRVLQTEAGADAALITVLELFSDISPPKIALTSRLVSTGDQPRILWMSGVGMAGDDAPGLLDLYLVEDPRILMEMAAHNLAGSLSKYVSGERERPDSPRASKKFRPKVAFRSPIIDPDLTYTLAVIPFLNLSERENAGELMALHFTRQLLKFENFLVIEPGVVRNALLDLRVILSGGISLANSDLIFNKLNADLILGGQVLDYQDYQGPDGTPKVDFSSLVIERKSREVVWTVKSYGEGDEGVFFFDWGKVNTAYAMAAQMVQLAVADLAE